MVSDSAYGIRLGPNTRSNGLHQPLDGTGALKDRPISTPNAISSPTSAMMSPKPVMIASIVFLTPTPAASPR